MSDSKNSHLAVGTPIAPPKVVGKIVVVKPTDTNQKNQRSRIVMAELDGSPSSVELKNWIPTQPIYPPQPNLPFVADDFDFPHHSSMWR